MHYKKTILLLIVSVFLIVCPSLVFSQQPGDWYIYNNLNYSRGWNSSVIVGDYIYTLGGFPYNETPYPVERAMINTDGSMSHWIVESTRMIIERESPIAFEHRGYLYALCGAGSGDRFGDSNYTTTIERAKINADASLGSWSTCGFTPWSIMEASFIKTSTYLYILGGYQISQDVYQVELKSDGSLGPFTMMTTKLNFGRHYHCSVLVDSTIYICGGFPYTPVEKATLYPDGGIGSFKVVDSGTTTSYLYIPHYGGYGFAMGGYLYIIGGDQYGFRAGERAKINPDGNLGYWESCSGFVESTRSWAGYAQTSTHLYAVGGNNGGDLRSVEIAPILDPTSIPPDGWKRLE